jgi:hypothetical protein
MLPVMRTSNGLLARCRQAIGGLLLASLVTGCSMVPNMDHGSSGCQNAGGIGPKSGDGAVTMAAGDSVMPELEGLSPSAAADAAMALGHTVVFNVQITGYGECWCVPPPEGKVVASWWNQHGALYLQIDGVDVGHTPDSQPASGWGC